jgi:glycosyltransferase involved in cell wall biosynthesis
LQDTFLLVESKLPEVLKTVCDVKGIVSCLYFPIDAPIEPSWAEIVTHVDVPVAYTQYGREEVRKALHADGRYENVDEFVERVAVIPHGVEQGIYQPLPRVGLREKIWPNWVRDEDLLLLNVNANQKRKDVARSLEILAALKQWREGWKDKPPGGLGEPRLVMHMPDQSAEGFSLETVGRQLGLVHGVEWGHHTQLFQSGLGTLSEEGLVRMYNAADLYLTTTLGEGWGLGITEALACGCPVAAPQHTSIREIFAKAATEGMKRWLVPFEAEAHYCWLPADNTRPRLRTNVGSAVDQIIEWWVHRKPQQPRQAGLSPSMALWLSWDRIAAEFERRMRAVKKEPKPVKSGPTEGSVERESVGELVSAATEL